jgi:hypothetical protein
LRLDIGRARERIIGVAFGFLVVSASVRCQRIVPETASSAQVPPSWDR